MAYVSTEDLVLYARNTGELYEAHKQLAFRGASEEEWRDHVLHNVTRHWLSEIVPDGSPWRFRASDCLAAGKELKAYYDRHIKEMVTYTLEAGRTIYRNGKPFIAIQRVGDTSPTDADDEARKIAAIVYGARGSVSDADHPTEYATYLVTR